MQTKTIKQVKLLNNETFKAYKEDFEEDFSTFEDYINVILGNLFDFDYLIDEIIPITANEVIIVYKISFGNKN